MRNERPEECHTCWKTEDAGGVSSRLRRAEYPTNDKVKNSYLSGNLKLKHDIEWLDLRVGRVCQFNCLYCSSEYSTSWELDYKKNGNFKSDEIHHHRFQKKHELSSLEKTDHFNLILKNISSLTMLNLTGGEPLLNPFTYTILEALTVSRKIPIIVSITTNGCADIIHWNKFLAHLNQLQENKNVRLYINFSCEAYGTQAEFIRQGLDFKLFQSRVVEILENYSISIHFAMTHNVLSISALPDFIKWAIQLKKKYQAKDRSVFLNSNFLNSPPYLAPALYQKCRNSLVVLRSINKIIDKNKMLLSDLEVDGLKTLDKIIFMPIQNETNVLISLKGFLDECDRRYATKWRSLFPELRQAL